MPTDKMTTPDVLKVAERLFGSFGAGDAEALDALFADDLLVWHSGDPAPVPKSEALPAMVGYMASSTDRRYVNVRRDALAGGGFVQQHTALFNIGGHEVSLEVCVVALVNSDGRITRIDEYLDRSGLG